MTIRKILVSTLIIIFKLLYTIHGNDQFQLQNTKGQPKPYEIFQTCGQTLVGQIGSSGLAPVFCVIE